MIGYNLNTEGRVILIGLINQADFEHTITDEPFIINDAQYYQLINNEWHDLRLKYKYIIMPCEIINDLLPLVNEVEDVLHPQFEILINSTSVTTRIGQYVDIQDKVVKFFICKLLQWDEGDKEQVQGIIGNWNLLNPDRQIVFNCCFEDQYELDEFLENRIVE